MGRQEQVPNWPRDELGQPGTVGATAQITPGSEARTVF